MIFIYSIYELNLAVPFPCPMLTPAPKGVVPDVTVVEGPVSRNLVNPAFKERTWQSAPGLFLFRGGRRAGRFLVVDGKEITLERNPAAEEDLLCALLQTIVLAALLRQRGLLVLHANVAVTPRGAIAISGESGSGKSTTQAGLINRGCSMLTDDVTVLRLNPDGIVVALPGIPKMNLCEDAAVKLGHDVDNLSRNPLLRLKVIVPVAPEYSMKEAVPLKAIYLISKHHGEVIHIKSLAGIEKFAALQDCIYGPQITEELFELFPLVSAVTKQVDILALQRPTKGCSVNRVVEAVLHG